MAKFRYNPQLGCFEAVPEPSPLVKYCKLRDASKLLGSLPNSVLFDDIKSYQYKYIATKLVPDHK